MKTEGRRLSAITDPAHATMTRANRPIEPDELAGLFAPLFQAGAVQPVALAVSGGSDSTALMVLFAEWLRREGGDVGRHTVLTVDHALRPESAAEARAVAVQAAALGFRHATLVWESAKPRTGIQAAARKARYRLMGGYLHAHGIGTLVTAHTRDDQAETLLMRLGRGSGLDGLAGIAPSTRVTPDIDADALLVIRPLLAVPKARLIATLEARGVSWTEDPSNEAPAFERSRLRAASAALEAIGLTGESVALSARRLQRARIALEAVTDSCCTAEGGVHTDRLGFFRIDHERLARMPEEIYLRVVGRCIAAAGGVAEPLPLAKLEPIVERLRRCGARERGAWTLARAHIRIDGGAVHIEREPGRTPLPVVAAAGGSRMLWDGRFTVEVATSLKGTFEVRALGADGLAELKRLGRAMRPARALRLVPAFWRGGDLLAVPTVDFYARPDLDGRLSAAFVGMRYNSGGR